MTTTSPQVKSSPSGFTCTVQAKQGYVQTSLGEHECSCKHLK